MDGFVRACLLPLILMSGLLGCSATTSANDEAAPPSGAALAALEKIEQIEADVGGRLGVGLVGQDGELLLAHRGDERFAMCSTFKAPLGAAILYHVQEGRLKLDQQLSFSEADVVSHAPMINRALERGETSQTVDWLVLAAMRASDNSAANLLLEQIGGPAGLTEFLRDQGDPTTRLDRWEPEMNENRLGDPRDTTSPVAMSQTMRTLLVGEALHPGMRAILTRHMIRTTTGLRRIRAGLPEKWIAGDKTGTCGSAYNDVAIFWDDARRPYLLSIYLDRPEADSAEAQAALADVARIVAELISEERIEGGLQS